MDNLLGLGRGYFLWSLSKGGDESSFSLTNEHIFVSYMCMFIYFILIHCPEIMWRFTLAISSQISTPYSTLYILKLNSLAGLIFKCTFFIQREFL